MKYAPEKLFCICNPIKELDQFDGLLDILLCDRSMNRNIMWACADYGFEQTAPIRAEDVKLIMPRFMKSKADRKRRQKSRAEVFTSSSICKLQNDLVVDGWNESLDFIDTKMLEITCGEAPYLVSRYDVVTGAPIEIPDRIGLLDRKLQLINRFVDNKNDWCNLARRAFQSIYGYEFQGDNLLLARSNLLLTADEYYREKFRDNPPPDFLKELATIVSWNLWQFDGIKNTVPFDNENTGIFSKCVIRDWLNRELVKFPSLISDGKFSETEL